MFNKLGTLFVTVLGVALLVYSATRSIDFISMTLPPERQVLAWFGLAALDGGLLAWLLAFRYGAKGWQRPIALVMTIVDLLGCVAMFTLDTILNTGQIGMTAALTSDQIMTAVLGLSLIIALNIAATVACHLLEPAALRAMAEEEALDRLDDEELNQIKQRAPRLAAEVAPVRASAWVENTRAKYLGLMTTTGKQPQVYASEASAPNFTNENGEK